MQKNKRKMNLCCMLLTCSYILHTRMVRRFDETGPWLDNATEHIIRAACNCLSPLYRALSCIPTRLLVKSARPGPALRQG